MDQRWLNPYLPGPQPAPLPVRRPRRPRQRVMPLLDGGMRIYRRHFFSFIGVGLCWLLPMAALYGSTLALMGDLGSRQLLSIFWPLALVDRALSAGSMAELLVLALLTCMALGLLCALSQTTADALSGRAPSWRRAWRVRPAKIGALLLLGVVYAILTMIAAVVVLCILGLLAMAAERLLESILDALPSFFDDEWLAFFLYVAIAYLLAISTIFTSFASGFSYAAQPIIQNEGPVLANLRAGVGLLFGNLAHNLRLWLGAGLVAAIFGLAICVGLLASLLFIPAAVLELEDEMIEPMILAVLALAGLVALPPIPICTALAYRELSAQQEQAAQLERRIQALVYGAGPPQYPAIR